MANTAMLGTMLMPEMRKRGYSEAMSMGPIMAGGGLAMMIPPSALAVILASIGQISIAKVLVGAILPGMMMAAFYAVYILGRAFIWPGEAPAYEAKTSNLLDRLWSFIRDLLPLGIIIFAVTGLIVIGVATPTEAAALGALSSVALAACYGRLTIKLLRAALFDFMRITVMTFAIMAAAIGFSQILAFSGATRGLLGTVLGLDIAPILLIVAMQAIVMVLGCFMEQISIMLITLPIFMPIVIALKFDPVWFAIIMLVNLETALMTPPFGLLLFVMKGVAPRGHEFRPDLPRRGAVCGHQHDRDGAAHHISGSSSPRSALSAREADMATLIEFGGRRPRVAANVFLAHNATLIGMSRLPQARASGSAPCCVATTARSGSAENPTSRQCRRS